MKNPQQDFMSATEITYGIVGWLAGVLSTVVGERLNHYLNRLKMNVIVSSQIITNTPTKHYEVLGFGITIEQGKELEDAYARYNGLFILGGKMVSKRLKPYCS
jgi:hypothetical protein